MLISICFQTWFATIQRKFRLQLPQKCYQTEIIRTVGLTSRNNSEKKSSWNILFYGSDDFAVSTLEMLNENRLQNKLISNLEVVNKNENSLTPVKSYAVKNGIKTHTWPYKIPDKRFDLGVVVSFGKLIPTDIINSFPYGMINIHPSLLPKYRGPAPIIHTVLNGDTETGVTIIEIAPKKFDVGKMLVQERIQIRSRITSEELSIILANIGKRILKESLKDFENLLKNAIPQPSEGVSQAPKPKKEMAVIKWDNITTHEIDRLYRAISGCFRLETSWQGTMVKIVDMLDPQIVKTAQINTLIPANINKPGTVFYHKKRKCLFIRCKDDWCGVKKVFVIGRPKVMAANEFASGYLLKVPLEERYFDF